MRIPDNIIKNKLNNVYFLWGRGKTTIANRLHEKYGFYIYSTDDSRERLWHAADPVHQPYMCRDIEKEYGVSSYWELPAQVVAEQEKHILEELTPMIILELIELARQHEVVICEGDIDYESMIPVTDHAVYLCNQGTKFDWFDRPDHDDLSSIRNRTDISEKEKEKIIENAYAIVSGDEGVLPDWVEKDDVNTIFWNDLVTVEKTLADVEQLFGFVR